MYKKQLSEGMLIMSTKFNNKKGSNTNSSSLYGRSSASCPTITVPMYTDWYSNSGPGGSFVYTHTQLTGYRTINVCEGSSGLPEINKYGSNGEGIYVKRKGNGGVYDDDDSNEDDENIVLIEDEISNCGPGLFPNANGDCVADLHDDKIDSSELTGKDKCAYEILEKTNGNLFKKTIGLFGVPGSKYDLNFTYDSCSTDGEMCTSAKDLANNNITIKINNTSGLSILEIATNFLHEGIHAEIYRYVHENGGNVDPNDRINLYNSYIAAKVESGSLANTDKAQHQHMADRYVYPIARAIREIDNKRFSVEHYLPFGWIGLSAYGKDGYYNENIDYVFFDLNDMWAKIKQIANTSNAENGCNE